MPVSVPALFKLPTDVLRQILVLELGIRFRFKDEHQYWEPAYVPQDLGFEALICHNTKHEYSCSWKWDFSRSDIVPNHDCWSDGCKNIHGGVYTNYLGDDVYMYLFSDPIFTASFKKITSY
jgi:hypothetical protein